MAEDALTELRWRDLVVEIMPDLDAPGPVGCPAKRYRFNPEFGCVLGVDIGIHKVIGLCTDLSGSVQGSHRVEVPADLDDSGRIEAARAALKRAVLAAHTRQPDILATGIAATVLTVDPDTVVVGGGLSRAGEKLLTPLGRRLEELCMFPIPSRPRSSANRTSLSARSGWLWMNWKALCSNSLDRQPRDMAGGVCLGKGPVGRAGNESTAPIPGESAARHG